ncbi:MAG: hypothetical protein QY330_01860 [Candidatus Dojkabacteria bacterium]|uniref:Uncharacterized protein n=1 Tax=Candidatus Dojkabacteria bacterium TaxID=2099670 RepID=A0A952AKS8_9BACT|nr:hypothetical protein [Candidatus Dojkabacteria bacterium]WKZ28333.1 MAG: hypothetical protein QY330_01860 [Candidatus Dojkabacteria bacterium]
MKIRFIALIIVSIFFFLYQTEDVEAAISYNGGWYTNLCGTGSAATAYSCPASCNPNSGSCSGTWVVKFTCGGSVTECRSNESDGSTFHSFDALNNQTQQIDVFDRNCRPNGRGNAPWACGPEALRGYMVWYHPSRCTNSCTNSNPTAPSLGSPANNARLATNTVTLTWSHSNWGGCGGNSCAGGCSATTPGRYRLRIYGPDPRDVYLAGNVRSYTVVLSGQSHSWTVQAINRCSRTATSGVRSFTINRPPTTTANIVSNELCLSNNLSSGWSGIHETRALEGRKGINNPLRVNAIYSDADGASTLQYMLIRYGNTANSTASKLASADLIRQGALGTIWQNSGIYRLYYQGGTNNNNNAQIGNGDAICTMAGSAIQVPCNVANIPDQAIAYAYPRIIRPATAAETSQPGSLFVEWELGFLNNSVFNGNGILHSYAADNLSVNSGYVAQGNWRTDLIAPSSTTNSQIISRTAISVGYQATDNNSILANQKTCRTNINQGNQIIRLTQTNPLIPTPLEFPTANTSFTPCFDNNLGNYNYSLNEPPNDGTLEFLVESTDIACNSTLSNTSSIRLKQPWMVSFEGDLYSRNGLRQTSISDINEMRSTYLAEYNGQIPYISGYSFMQRLNSNVSRASKLNFRLNNYEDLNSKPRATTGFANWFDYVSASVDAISANRTTSFNGDQSFTGSTNLVGETPTNGFPGSLPSERVNLVRVNGDLTISNLVCNTKTIFLINGNLQVEPNVTIQDNPISGIVNGCMFVASGSINVLEGNDAAGGADTGTNTAYDDVYGFFLGESFTTQADTNFNGLRIKGSVIAELENNLNRSNGIVLNQFAPAEIFIYDGGRYIGLFGDILSSPLNYNIAEKGFLDALD